MRPMMRLVLGLGALVVILIGVAFALPSHVTVYRSVVINASEGVVFPYLNNLHRFVDWSPWAARDPQLRVTYAGPEEGKGAHTEWTSEKRSVGAGSMEITGSDPNRHLDLVVSFNGMDGTSYYEVAPSGSGSKVTWGFGVDMGGNPFRRWQGLMLDRIVGTEYRDGLAKLKDRIEAERQPTAGPAAGAAVPPSTTVPVAEGTPAASSSTQAEQPAGTAALGEKPPQTASTPAPAAAPKPQPPKTPKPHH
ncbi:MAG: SRPBCC family protein [Methyloceanibacter sp.]